MFCFFFSAVASYIVIVCCGVNAEFKGHGLGSPGRKELLFGSYVLALTEQHTPKCVSSLMNKAKQFLLPQDQGKHLSNIYYFLKPKRGPGMYRE